MLNRHCTGLSPASTYEPGLLPLPSLSKRRRYYVARRPSVTLSHCVCVYVRLCLSAEPRLRAHRIGLGGEGNALYSSALWFPILIRGTVDTYRLGLLDMMVAFTIFRHQTFNLSSLQ